MHYVKMSLILSLILGAEVCTSQDDNFLMRDSCKKFIVAELAVAGAVGGVMLCERSGVGLGLCVGSIPYLGLNVLGAPDIANACLNGSMLAGDLAGGAVGGLVGGALAGYIVHDFLEQTNVSEYIGQTGEGLLFGGIAIGLCTAREVLYGKEPWMAGTGCAAMVAQFALAKGIERYSNIQKKVQERR